MKEKYKQEVIPGLMARYGYKNVMQVPRLEKMVLNIGVGEGIQNARALEAAEKDLAAVSGQHPVKAIKHSAFVIQTGQFGRGVQQTSQRSCAGAGASNDKKDAVIYAHALYMRSVEKPYIKKRNR